MEKCCNICKEIKPLEEFRKSKSRPGGIEYVCKICKRLKEAEWRNKNRDAKRAQQREHYKNNRALILKKRKEDYDPLKGKARWLAKKITAGKCVFCDKLGERHHKDYHHPLDIVFLCKSHHKQIHDGTIIL